MIVPQGCVSIEEAARLLGCSTGTVYRLIKAGQITALRPKYSTRGFVIRRDEIENYERGYVRVQQQS